jgi:hypothetical protein
LRTWLEAKLGPLASLRVKARDSKAARAMLSRIGADVVARTTRPLAGFYSLVKAVEGTLAAMSGDEALDQSSNRTGVMEIGGGEARGPP